MWHPYAVDAIISAVVCVVTLILTLVIGLSNSDNLWPMTGLTGVTFGIFVVNLLSYIKDRQIRGVVNRIPGNRKTYINYFTWVLKNSEIEKTFEDL
jgi:hypothetical protein